MQMFLLLFIGAITGRHTDAGHFRVVFFFASVRNRDRHLCIVLQLPALGNLSHTWTYYGRRKYALVLSNAHFDVPMPQ